VSGAAGNVEARFRALTLSNEISQIRPPPASFAASHDLSRQLAGVRWKLDPNLIQPRRWRTRSHRQGRHPVV